MTNLSPIKLVRRYFPYLFDEDQFRILEWKQFESFGNWVVLLQAEKKCRIRIFQDRGEILLSVGPSWPISDWEAGPWYDITVVLTELGESVDKLSQNSESTEMQLELVSELVSPLITKICGLFSGSDYEKNRERLEQIKNRFEDEAWDKLA